MTPESDNPPPEREVSPEFKSTAEEIAINISFAIDELEENQILAPDPILHPDLGDERTFLDLSPAEQSHLKQRILKEIDFESTEAELANNYPLLLSDGESEEVNVYQIGGISAYLHMRERDFFISGSPTDPNELT
jgi:hypothetical protein